MKKFFLALTALIAITASAVAADRYVIRTADFDRLKVTDGIAVDWRCHADSAGLVVFHCSKEMASKIGATHSNGRLELSFTTTGVKGHGLPLVTVYSTSMSQVENCGDSVVRVVNAPAVKKFAAKVVGNGRIVAHGVHADDVNAHIATGNGQIILSGKCDQAHFKMTGTGTIEADRLEAKTVNIRAIGTGSIGCWPIDLLKIHGMGSTTILYRGTPAEVVSRGVGLKLERLP